MSVKEQQMGYSILVMAAIVIVLAGVKAASVIVVPFLLSLFLAIILSPLFLWFRSKRLPQGVALLLIVLLLFGLVGTLIMLIGTSVQDFSHNVPVYEAKLRHDFKMFLSTLEGMGITIPKEDILAIFATDSVMEYIAKTLRSLGGLLTNSFMIIVTVIFMLMEISQFTEKLERSNADSLRSLMDVSDNVKHFILLKSMTSAATGLIVTVGLELFDIHYAILWGVVAFLLNFIPNIGSILAAVPAVLMTLVQYNIATALAVMGRGLGLSTLIVFLSLIFWGWLLGPVGMLLSVPLTIMVKILLDARENTRWIATLLGN